MQCIYNDESEENVPTLKSYKKYIYALVKEDLLMLLEILLHENIIDIQMRVFDHVLDFVKLEVKDIVAQNLTHPSEQRMLTYLRKYMKSKKMN